jgi:hypothetical protein
MFDRWRVLFHQVYREILYWQIRHGMEGLRAGDYAVSPGAPSRHSLPLLRVEIDDAGASESRFDLWLPGTID